MSLMQHGRELEAWRVGTVARSFFSPHVALLLVHRAPCLIQILQLRMGHGPCQQNGRLGVYLQQSISFFEPLHAFTHLPTSYPPCGNPRAQYGVHQPHRILQPHDRPAPQMPAFEDFCNGQYSQESNIGTWLTPIERFPKNS